MECGSKCLHVMTGDYVNWCLLVEIGGNDYVNWYLLMEMNMVDIIICSDGQ